MSVRIVPARGGKGFEYDIRFGWPEGGSLRERGKCPPTGKVDARRWAEQRERVIAAAGKAEYRPLSGRVPVSDSTLAGFWPRVLQDHYRANRKKPSTIDGAERIWRLHLEPTLGAKPLNGISTLDIAALKGTMAEAEPKTVNNVLAVLSRILHCAVDWGVLPSIQCKFGLLKVPEREMAWYEPDVFRRLVKAAEACSPQVHLLVLLGGSAGLRRGEIAALKWTDIDFERKLVNVQRSLWKDEEGTTKGAKPRLVPLTDELVTALKNHRSPFVERVLNRPDGEVTKSTLASWMARAQRRANLEKTSGGVHILRHTFCSHLALAGAVPKAIQELAGHKDIKTTMRYMHLSPENRAGAIGLLGRLYEATGTD